MADVLTYSIGGDIKGTDLEGVKNIFVHWHYKNAKKTVDGFVELYNGLEEETVCITEVGKNVFLFRFYKVFNSNDVAIEFSKNIKSVYESYGIGYIIELEDNLGNLITSYRKWNTSQ